MSDSKKDKGKPLTENHDSRKLKGNLWKIGLVEVIKRERDGHDMEEGG